MVKPSEIELPIVYKDVLLFKSGQWNDWNISNFEVNKSVANTNWNQINSSLMFSHREKETEAWAGSVKNIYTKNGSTYGDIHIYHPDTGFMAKYGDAPFAISAGIAWPKEYREPTNFFYTHFGLVLDPGVLDPQVYLNGKFNAQEKPTGNFNTATFSTMLGTPLEQHMNTKDDRGEKKKKEDEKDEEVTKANMEQNAIAQGNYQTTEQVVTDKLQEMESMVPEDNTNINERRSKNEMSTEKTVPSIDEKLEALEARLAYFEESKKANFEAIAPSVPAQPVTQVASVAPVVVTNEAPKAAEVPIVKPTEATPLTQSQPQASLPVVDEKVIDNVASRIFEKLNASKPNPVTTREFGGSPSNQPEDAVERLVKSLSVNK